MGKKLKAPWVKTDIPKPIKIELLRITRDYPTQAARRRAAELSEAIATLGTQLDAYVPTSPDTFKRLERELMEMPANEVILLPEDLQNWIKSIRPELANQLEAGWEPEQRTGRHHEGLRRVPETDRGVEEVIGLGLMKEKEVERHTGLVLDLLEAYGNQLKVSEPEEILEQQKGPSSGQPYNSRLTYYNFLLAKVIDSGEIAKLAKSGDLRAIPSPNIERDPLFESVTGHYERTQLWETISRYKKEAGEYLGAIVTLIALIDERFHANQEVMSDFLGMSKEMIQASLGEIRVRLSAEGVIEKRKALESLPVEFLAAERLMEVAKCVQDDEVTDENHTFGNKLNKAVDEIVANYERIKRLEKEIESEIAKEKFKGFLPPGSKCEYCPICE